LSRRNLLDLNVLIALTEPGHSHHKIAWKWFSSTSGTSWGVCPLTEAGFLRVTTNPSFKPVQRTVAQAIAILQALKEQAGFRYWEMASSWVEVTAPFSKRIVGHQQITDAYLLGLAIEANGRLVTFDRAIMSMAGEEYFTHVRLLE